MREQQVVGNGAQLGREMFIKNKKTFTVAQTLFVRQLQNRHVSLIPIHNVA